MLYAVRNISRSATSYHRLKVSIFLSWLGVTSPSQLWRYKSTRGARKMSPMIRRGHPKRQAGPVRIVGLRDEHGHFSVAIMLHKQRYWTLRPSDVKGFVSMTDQGREAPIPD